MALELDALLRTKNLSRSAWQSMLRFFDGRVASLEASKNVDEAIREDVLARGLTVINDHIQPALDSSATKVAQIEALRVSADAIHAQLEEALEFGANTDLVTEGPGGLNRYFTPLREQALKDDLRGAGLAAARDTLKEISDALDAEIAAIKGGVGAQHDTLAEISAAIAALQTSLTAKSDVGHTHTITAVSGLQGQLDAKAAANHLHTVADLPAATAAQFRGNVADRVLVTDDVWAAAVPFTATFGTPLTLDFRNGFDFLINANADFVLNFPIFPKAGQKGLIKINPVDAPRLMTLQGNVGWITPNGAQFPTFTGPAVLSYWVENSGQIWLVRGILNGAMVL